MKAKELQAEIYTSLMRNVEIAKEHGHATTVTIANTPHLLMSEPNLLALFASIAANLAQGLVGETIEE